MTPEQKIALQAKLDQIAAFVREFGKAIRRAVRRFADALNKWWARWGRPLTTGMLRCELEDHRNMLRLTGGQFGTLTHGQVKHRRDMLRHYA